MRPTAISYVRQEISGVNTLNDQAAARELATRWGFELIQDLVVGSETLAPTLRLVRYVLDNDADALIVPDKRHIWPVRRAVTELCDLIMVEPQRTWKRGHRWPPVAFDPHPERLAVAPGSRG